MKQDIHPKYQKATVVCASCHTTFERRLDPAQPACRRSAPTATRSIPASRRSSTPPARWSVSRSDSSARRGSNSACRDTRRRLDSATDGAHRLRRPGPHRGRPDARPRCHRRRRLRHPDGPIVGAQEPLDAILHRNRFARAPFFRGIVVLYETLVIGTRWLMRCGLLRPPARAWRWADRDRADAAHHHRLRARPVRAGAAVPGQARPRAPRCGADQAFVQHLIEGLDPGRSSSSATCCWSADRRRSGGCSSYHGAEHMTIHALEHEQPLDIDHVRQYPTAHPRCGTEFLVVFIIV